MRPREVVRGGLTDALGPLKWRIVVVEEEAGVLSEAPIRVAYSPLYWTAHCEGFIVDTHEGRFGIVEEVHVDADGEPAWLGVRSEAVEGLLLIPVGDIAVVQPHRERIVLETSWADGMRLGRDWSGDAGHGS